MGGIIQMSSYKGNGKDESDVFELEDMSLCGTLCVTPEEPIESRVSPLYLWYFKGSEVACDMVYI